MGALAWITGILLTLIFLASGVGKVTRQGMATGTAAHLGYTDLLVPLGTAEMLGAIGVLIGLVSGNGTLEWLGFLGGVGLLMMMVGAVIYHRKAGDPGREIVPAVVLAVACVLYLAAIMGR